MCYVMSCVCHVMWMSCVMSGGMCHVHEIVSCVISCVCHVMCHVLCQAACVMCMKLCHVLCYVYIYICMYIYMNIYFTHRIVLVSDAHELAAAEVRQLSLDHYGYGCS
jgi:hypothetical protein